jgi:hypothetical protein
MTAVDLAVHGATVTLASATRQARHLIQVLRAFGAPGPRCGVTLKPVIPYLVVLLWVALVCHMLLIAGPGVTELRWSHGYDDHGRG